MWAIIAVSINAEPSALLNIYHEYVLISRVCGLAKTFNVWQSASFDINHNSLNHRFTFNVPRKTCTARAELVARWKKEGKFLASKQFFPSWYEVPKQGMRICRKQRCQLGISGCWVGTGHSGEGQATGPTWPPSRKQWSLLCRGEETLCACIAQHAMVALPLVLAPCCPGRNLNGKSNTMKVSIL